MEGADNVRREAFDVGVVLNVPDLERPAIPADQLAERCLTEYQEMSR